MTYQSKPTPKRVEFHTTLDQRTVDLFNQLAGMSGVRVSRYLDNLARDEALKHDITSTAGRPVVQIALLPVQPTPPAPAPGPTTVQSTIDFDSKDPVCVALRNTANSLWALDKDSAMAIVLRYAPDYHLNRLDPKHYPAVLADITAKLADLEAAPAGLAS